RRQTFAAAGEDREKRATRRMRTTRPALEPRAGASGLVGHRALQRMFEQPDVSLRRADEHRHLVERDAAPRLLHDPPRDLDAFASFAGRREEPHVPGGLALGRLRFREQIPTERHEIAVPSLLDDIRIEAEGLESIERREVAEGDRDKDGGWRLEDGGWR